jgi:hypothetical protein
MLLPKLLFFMLSLACTLSSAQPFCPSNGPVNNAIMRNNNGATGIFFNEYVAITISQAYIETSSRRPFGGVQLAISNAYCFSVRVTITLVTGYHYTFSIRSGGHHVQVVVPERIAIGGLFHVGVEMDTGT